MSKRVSLSVITAAFEATLHRHNAREAFFFNWSKQRYFFEVDNEFLLWKKTRRERHPYDWIATAFEWDNTNEGFGYWATVDREWTNWVCNNLNK